MTSKMTKFKHNKKRNTAFLYESLVIELTRAMLKSDLKKKAEIISLIKESFNKNKELYKELKLYHALSKTNGLHVKTAEKILSEVKREREVLDENTLTKEQEELTRKMKKYFSDDAMSNFVPNYKTLATISQIFSRKGPVKTRVLLENQILQQMSSSGEGEEKEKMVPIDNLVYKTFVKKFNSEYSEGLLSEQRELLSKYISSFADNGLSLKIYLNDEVGRLKEAMNSALSSEEIKNDENMLQKAQSVVSILESYRAKQPERDMVKQVIKIQELVSEITSDANQD